MADIRINALPTTATDFASDDYIAIDGTTNGTRKLNAKTANLTFSDVTLGTSGPSVKSTLSARAPRQGLVFDGTAGATVANVPALGTGDFTVAAWVNPTTLATTGIIAGATNSFGLRLISDGTLKVGKVNASDGTASTGTITSGKFTHISYVRNGSTGTYYINGVASGTSSESGLDYSVAPTLIGAFGGSTSQVFSGLILYPIVENRALSASEVVALYEAGAPSGADYNSASNTAVYSTDFSTSTGWSFGGGGSGISGGKLNLVDNDYAAAPSSTALKTGKRYRFTVTVDSITAGNVSYYNGSAYVSFATSAGTYTVDFTAPAAYSFLILKSFGGNAVCDTFAFYNTGLLLAPDAAQAGGGLTWYDTSGNAANINLPASGVSWNVPTSGYWGGNLTVSGGTITGGTSGMSLASGGTNQNITLTPNGTGRSNAYGSIPSSTWAANDLDSSFNAGLVVGPRGTGSSFGVSTASASSGYPSGMLVDGSYAAPNSTVNIKAVGVYSGGGYGASLAFHTSSNTTLSEVGRFTKAGNFLLGTTTDGGNGKLQLATHSTSAGGIGFGTDISLYRNGSGGLLATTAGTLTGGVGVGYFSITTSGTAPLVLGTNGVEGARFSTTQNFEIASGKALRLGNAYTAGAPTATGYVTIQDSSGTTYKVLVGT